MQYPFVPIKQHSLREYFAACRDNRRVIEDFCPVADSVELKVGQQFYGAHGGSAFLDVFEESHLPGLFDEGGKRSAGEFVVLLDNDTIVPKHWIEQLTGLAVSQPKVGVVGPMSNHACPPQLIPLVPNWTPSQPAFVGIEKRSGVGQAVGIEQTAEAFAQEWRVGNQGKWLEASELESFCLLFKRNVLASLRSLSRLARSPAELIDGRLLDRGALGKKILLSGYKLACCADLIVYRAGTSEEIYLEQDTDIDVCNSHTHVKWRSSGSELIPMAASSRRPVGRSHQRMAPRPRTADAYALHLSVINSN